MMQLVNGKIVMGKKNCSCGDGTQATNVRCTACSGTRRGLRGGARGCKKCHGNGTRYDYDIRSTCTTCNGNFKDHADENTCDNLPQDIYDALPVRVYYTNNMTVGESLIGLGCVCSCGDFGGAWKNRDDDKLIAYAKSQRHVQATALVDRDNRLCDHIGVFVSERGFAIKPVFVTPAVVV